MTIGEPLSAREREILDLVYRLGSATATEVIEAMKQPPSRSAVRTFLRILEDKGYLKHKTRGREYVYTTLQSRTKVGRKAVAHVLETFFGGSLSDAVASYLASPRKAIDDDELRKLQTLIDSVQTTEEKSSEKKP